MHTITKAQLEQTLAHRINEGEAELEALKRVVINTKHKTLTNKAVEGGTIGDYIGIGKALYVYYEFRKDGVHMSHQKLDINAYTYNNPDGTEIGSSGGLRTSRTMTPAELQKVVNDVIAGREESLVTLKRDLANADKIVTKYNKLATQLGELTEGVTWATRSVLK